MGNKAGKFMMFQTKDEMQAVAKRTLVGGLAFIHDEQALYFRVDKGWQLITLGDVLPLPKEDTVDGNKRKQIVIKSLTIKDTHIADVDTVFSDAAEPFNNAVDVKESLDNAIKSFKELTGHEEKDSIKVVVLDLKKQFPNLKVEIEDGPKLVLTTGCEDDESIDLSKKVTKSYEAISDLVTKMNDLMKQAVDSAKSVIDKSDELTDAVKNAGLNPFQVSKALLHASHNFVQFKKVPPIGKAFKQLVEDIVEDVKETKKALENPEENSEDEPEDDIISLP